MSPHEPPEKLHGFAWASREAGAVWLGFLPLGMGLGILTVNNGLPWWCAPVLSGLVYAGSVEFILVSLIAAGTPVASIALTTLLVNSRHIFYGLSFPLDRLGGGWARLYGIFGLSDEAFALLTGRGENAPDRAAILWTQLGLHLSWIGGSTLGALLGAGVIGEVRGIGFILISLFVVLAIDAYRARPDALILFLALGSAVLAMIVAPAQMLVLALGVFALSLLARFRLQGRSSAHG